MNTTALEEDDDYEGSHGYLFTPSELSTARESDKSGRGKIVKSQHLVI